LIFNLLSRAFIPILIFFAEDYPASTAWSSCVGNGI